MLVGYWHMGWRGCLAIHWTHVGFFLLLLAYFGSKLVLETLLKRG
jgi:ABC-type uncharacterized transport system permease subunit